MKNHTSILSIDGGGIKGIIPALILNEIEKRTGKPIYELFDLIAGTSTGGIIALGLTAPGSNGKAKFTAADLVHLYEVKGDQIFPQTMNNSLSAKISDFFGLISYLRSTTQERYSQVPYEQILWDYFGDARLKDALTPLLITSYEIEKRIPWLFKSRNAKRISTYDFPMWQVARATSAAPTYFEPCKIAREDEPGKYWALVDGGLFANNPALCAMVDIYHTASADPNRTFLLSLGTGESVKPYKFSDASNWGLLGWVRPVIDISFDGVSKTVDYQLKHIMPHTNYYRFQPELDENQNDLDNIKLENIESLKRVAHTLIYNKSKQIDKLCALLTGTEVLEEPQE